MTHRHTLSGLDGVNSNPQLSDASVANPHTSLPNPTYVSKHIPAFSITLPHPKGVFQHQPKLPNLLNPTTNTNSNGCFQANLPTTGLVTPFLFLCLWCTTTIHKTPCNPVFTSLTCAIWTSWRRNKRSFMQQGTREFSNKRESFPPAVSCPNAVKGILFFVKLVC